MNQDLLSNLNPQQKEAAAHKNGPLLIVAGAGTGKTTVITKRIAWLIDQGLAKPENILALTFTDKAAGEMEERVDVLLPYGYVDLQISTFHSFCEKLLRDYGAEIGLSRDFKVTSELDAWLLTRREFERFELDYYRPLGNPTKYIRSLLTHFSRAKDAAIYPDDYLDFAEQLTSDKDSAQSDAEVSSELKKTRELANAYHTYQQILLENDCLDFGDLLLFALKLLKERPHILKEIRQRFKYILVDEFQDTNLVQYEIIKILAAPDNNLTVVGDDDQSIYKFRGASLANILHFQKDYPDCKTIVLTDNYRSGQQILDQAYNFIQQNNPNRLEVQLGESLSKQLSAKADIKDKVEHIHVKTLDEEVAAVTDRITELKVTDPDLTWNDFAILVRSNDAAGPFLAALEKRQVPYHFLALQGLYNKEIILDVLSYLRVIDNPYESPSLYRLLAHPMYQIPELALSELNHFATRKGKSLWQACKMVRSIEHIESEVITKVDRLCFLIEKLSAMSSKQKTTEFFITVAKETGLIGYVNELPEQEKHDSFRYLQQFYQRVKSFDERSEHPILHNFLEEFKHERDAGEEGSLSFDIDSGPEMVRVMTVHASKGLEFKHVFIVNLVDRRFPTQKRAEAIPLPEGLVKEDLPEGDWHLEEERRLFYVAMTRAKQSLTFCSAEDYGGARKKKLSRFLSELGLGQAEAQNQSNQDLFSKQPDTKPESKPVVIHLPKRFSFTQLAAFRNCPLQYKYAHILRIPVFGKYQMSFGRTMHNTLQHFFETWLERVGQQQTSLFDQPADSPDGLPITLDELITMYNEAWQDEWYQSDKQREEYRQNGLNSLKSYYSIIEKDLPEPLSLEQGFTLKIHGVVLKGKIDRIDKFEDGVELIDYKTGSPKEESKITIQDKEQLFLYQLAARDVLGINPTKLTFHYLEDNSKVSFLGTDDQLLNLQEQITDRVEKIKNSDFNATPGWHCKFCDFADICKFRQK
ncbi:ATP-dependent helicase [Patescibacteria group bacterium]